METPHPIEKWFSGKALAVIQTFVLPTLKQAEELGYWPKGVSRKIRAALNKQNVAKKFAKTHDRNYDHRDHNFGKLEDVADVRGSRWHEAKLRGYNLVVAMSFGQFESAPKLRSLATNLVPFCLVNAELDALATATQWCEDFIPVAELVSLLDSRRPRPTIVCKTLSPTVLENLNKTLSVDLRDVQGCPVEYVWVDRINKKGEKYQISVAVLKWPEGTQHGVSRFSWGSKAGNKQCEACGHAIKDSCNWIPLVGLTPTGPISLWTGKDCAHNLFGCEIDGEAEYKRSEDSVTKTEVAA